MVLLILFNERQNLNRLRKQSVILRANEFLITEAFEHNLGNHVREATERDRPLD
jgi:hypothetical protein